MKKKIICLSFVSFFIAQFSFAEESIYWKDFKETFSFMAHGSLEQFKTKNNLYYVAPAAGSLWYSFENDKKISDRERAKSLNTTVKYIGEMGVLLSFPVIPVTMYSFGLKNQNVHQVQFAKEFMASLYLALIESNFISQINIHARPDQKELSPWETKFRGRSSFPSGHVVPYATLMFKGFQFYGAKVAVPAAVLTYFSCMQRVRSGRHYVSDVVGGIWLAAFASEGVRQVANYEHNHEHYNQIFAQKYSLNFVPLPAGGGLILSYIY